MIRAVVPVRAVSTLNAREHWAAKARRAAAHRGAAHVALLAASVPSPPTGPVRVLLTRIGPRRLDSDNLAGACKAIRDGVADWLGIDDGDPRVTWEYGQRRGKAREYAVEVEVEVEALTTLTTAGLRAQGAARRARRAFERAEARLAQDQAEGCMPEVAR